MTTEIDYGSRTLTIQDLKDRIAYLEGIDTDEDQWRELEALNEIDNDLHWADASATLVNYNHWEGWCREYVVDLGEVREDSAVFGFIKWDELASAMEQDYKSFDMPDGTTFMVRA